MLLLDSAVGSRELLPYLHKAALSIGNNPPVKISMQQLRFDTGRSDLPYACPDIAWEGLVEDPPFSGKSTRGKFCIERKTVTDFVDSMRSERLVYQQLPSMLLAFRTSYIVIEGRWRDRNGKLQTWDDKLARYVDVQAGKFKDVTYKEVEGYICSLEHIANIHIIRTWNTDETANLAVVKYLYFQKPTHRSLGLTGIGARVVKFKPKTKTLSSLIRIPSLAWAAAAQIRRPRGIGDEIAKRLADKFGSLHALVNASADELDEVEGISKERAAALHKAFRSRY